MKFKILAAICLLTALMCLLVGTVYAWITVGETTVSMVFNIAKINSTITLYKGVDSNQNGVLDYGWDDGEDTETVPIHPLYQMVGDPQAALQEGSATINVSMELDDMLPSQIYTFKLHILNEGEADNFVRITFVGYNTQYYTETLTGADFDEFIDCLKILSLTVGIVNEDNTITYSGKNFFANSLSTFTVDPENTDNRPCNYTAISEILIQNSLIATNRNEIDLILRFQIESRDTINAMNIQLPGGTTLYLSEEDYQAYQGKVLKLPLMSVYMEIYDPDEL
ncbi:MAG TPA: hypothetical protein PK675_00300 [Clostridia bacterium]|nr:hypothetical protein [Clostridia bacterium]